VRYNNNMSFDSKGKQAETEADIFEDIPISFEETKPVSHKKEQTTEEAVNPEAITEPRKKSLEDRFSFPKGLGELLGGFAVTMIGFAIGGSSPTNVLALLGLLSIAKGIITLLGASAIYIYKKAKTPLNLSESTTDKVVSKKCQNCKKAINNGDKFCPKCGARQ
jgi:hypothetical protein